MDPEAKARLSIDVNLKQRVGLFKIRAHFKPKIEIFR